MLIVIVFCLSYKYFVVANEPDYSPVHRLYTERGWRLAEAVSRGGLSCNIKPVHRNDRLSVGKLKAVTGTTESNDIPGRLVKLKHTVCELVLSSSVIPGVS